MTAIWAPWLCSLRRVLAADHERDKQSRHCLKVLFSSFRDLWFATGWFGQEYEVYRLFVVSVFFVIYWWRVPSHAAKGRQHRSTTFWWRLNNRIGRNDIKNKHPEILSGAGHDFHSSDTLTRTSRQSATMRLFLLRSWSESDNVEMSIKLKTQVSLCRRTDAATVGLSTWRAAKRSLHAIFRGVSSLTGVKFCRNCTKRCSANTFAQI